MAGLKSFQTKQAGELIPYFDIRLPFSAGRDFDLSGGRQIHHEQEKKD